MKGFLHRVAAGVVQPRQTLHPFVQSIFTPSIESSQAGYVSPQEPLSIARPATQRSLAPRDAQPSTMQPAINRTADSREHFEPVLPVQNERSVVIDRGLGSQDSGEGRNPNHAEGLLSRSGKEQVHNSGEESESDSASIAGFIPIVLGMDSGLARDDKEQLSQSITQSAAYAETAKAELTRMNGRRQAAQPAPATHAIPSQSDDIQIHIGRIEVIAAPPVMQRPAAAAPRKGLSLDEYLAKRNGRSR